MSDITAVPLRPVAKGTLTLLWAGVAIGVLAAGALAWAGTAKDPKGICLKSDFAKGAVVTAAPSGVMFQTVKAGQGPSPTDSDITLVDYKGSLRDKTVFDQAQRTPLPVAGMIPGFSEALKKMQAGGNYKFCIPAAQGYGAKATGPIPANSALMFDVSLLDFRSQAEVEAIQRQQQQGGVPVGPDPRGGPGGR
jgi:FKBP-type peptidyl-prolyl cis-trans isomerase FkpA